MVGAQSAINAGDTVMVNIIFRAVVIQLSHRVVLWSFVVDCIAVLVLVVVVLVPLGPSRPESRILIFWAAPVNPSRPKTKEELELGDQAAWW